MTTDQTASGLPPPGKGGPRTLVVWNDGRTDIDAELARLAGPAGIRPDDEIVIVRWLSEGEVPDPQIQPKLQSEGDALQPDADLK